MMVFNGFLDPILSPLLNSLGSLGFVAVISFIISLITILVYKYTTDQVLMKNLKEEIERLNKEAKKHSHNQQKMMSMQKEAMSKQFQMMKHSLFSNFIVILPIFIIFGWLTAHLAYSPINENEEFTVSVLFVDYKGNVELVAPKGIAVVGDAVKSADGKADWVLKGNEGSYLIEFNVDNKTYNKDVLITDKQQYAEQAKAVNDGVVKQIQINYKPNKVLNLGFFKLGWLGSYIIFALLFSIILRKLLKVY